MHGCAMTCITCGVPHCMHTCIHTYMHVYIYIQVRIPVVAHIGQRLRNISFEKVHVKSLWCILIKWLSVTLFRSIPMFCGSNNIRWNIFRIQTKRVECFVEFCQSHITLLWMYIMLCRWYFECVFKIESGSWTMMQESSYLQMITWTLHTNQLFTPALTIRSPKMHNTIAPMEFFTIGTN